MFAPRRSARIAALRIKNLTPLQAETEVRTLKLETYQSLRTVHIELSTTNNELRMFLKYHAAIQEPKPYIKLLDTVRSAWVDYHIFAREIVKTFDRTALGRPIPCVEFMNELSKHLKNLCRQVQNNTEHILKNDYIPSCHKLLQDIKERSQ